MSIALTIFMGGAKAAVSKLADAGLNAVLNNVKIEGVTLAVGLERGKMLVLSSFTGKGWEPSFENQVKQNFRDLQTQVGGLKKDIKVLQKEMADFKWEVKELFNKVEEDDLWKFLLALDNTLDSLYDDIGSVVDSAKGIEERRKMALDLSRNIKSTLKPQVMNIKNCFHGGDVVGDLRTKGFLEIWQWQALRDADKGWDDKRLAEIYGLLEAKFTRVLLIQIRCLRLLIEAYEALHADDSGQKSGVDYFVDVFYPVLKEEVEGFRGIIESLAINLIPLPSGALVPLAIPDNIAGMLARLDMFLAQALMGKVSDSKMPVTTGRELPTAPALAGVWGRVIVPSARWIKRKAGTKEDARVTVIKQSGGTATFNGVLEVRTIKYLPYETSQNDHQMTLHKGYQIQVGNELRDMNDMLLVHFTPNDVLPNNMPEGEVDVTLETPSGELLVQTRALIVLAPLDEKGQAPYGTFMMSFTGGAGIRAR